MIVLKFGGTSVGSDEAIVRVGDIITRKSQSDQVVAVVSAVGGVTNMLVHATKLASEGDSDYLEVVKQIEQTHFDLVKSLLPIKKQSGLLGKIKLQMNQLEELLKGFFLLKEVTPKSNDYVLGFGERLSSFIITEYLTEKTDKVNLLDPLSIITCNEEFGNGTVDLDETMTRAQAQHSELSTLNICPGFIAATKKGDLITLGRGGSDYTAALLANLWGAESLEIWTDVDGLMTADPRIVSNGRIIPHLSYEEALELSHFGAKVIYPPSIQPALEKNIPIQIKNTFNPEFEGTLITRSWEDTEAIRGLSSIKDISLLNLTGSGMVGIPNFSFRLFQALSEVKVNVILITQASSEHSICVGISTSDISRAVNAINSAFTMEIKLHLVNHVEAEEGLAVIALVGSNMRNQVGISGQLFSTLARNGVSVKAIAQGSSERNISFVVDELDLKKSLNAIHESFFIDEVKKVNLFAIGAGNVGQALLGQLESQTKYLEKHHNLLLRVVGLANSKQMIFDESGVTLDIWKDTSRKKDFFTPDAFLSSMFDLNLRNSVFLDMTASGDITELYSEVLKKSISVVTPNKIGATSSFQHFQTLKFLAKKYKSQFLFETNVCAGLPVISTLSDLIKSGDNIHRIEAVLSGTLNYLFNNYDGSRKFSEIVKQAWEEGYTEPDPKLDLSGQDVMRKILILARESGSQMEYEDVVGNSFVPEKCMNVKGFEKFLDSLSSEEGYFKQILNEAKKTSSRIRYVAKYENNAATTGLEYVGEDHPFYNLEGKDNIVLFYTDRYSEQPLVVKGAGAGADVTASGIFADIMKVAHAG